LLDEIESEAGRAFDGCQPDLSGIIRLIASNDIAAIALRRDAEKFVRRPVLAELVHVEFFIDGRFFLTPAATDGGEDRQETKDDATPLTRRRC